MSIERMVLAFAGSFILISLILSQLFSPYWLLFTAFVGVQSAPVGLYRFLSTGKDPEGHGSGTRLDF
jgi:hypothetical protein